ncbi:hypothetical protein QPK32_08685 [Massilia sp. YIM B02763]|uniref:hypothetical protein n=1 Tax=Massilia sp. YIM B02763 TaxID=3050130 RepID=UPI0025B6E954|nr:hypothetical protein [Massilia sp. YIM B02763]MDN4053153.1 hypothetical protein [Massilia sp. YIM B02763]
MPTFIIAGFQKSVSNQIRAALNKAKPNLRNWRWELFPSNENSESKISEKQVPSLLDMAEKNDGAHIFGVTAQRQNGAAPDIGSMLKSYFRLRWLPAQAVRSLGGGVDADFLQALTAAIDEEDYWIEHVKPKDVSSPLILPELFETMRGLDDMWHLSESYNDIGLLTSAAKKIERFQAQHRRRHSSGSKSPWIDANEDWRWEDNGAPHGEAVQHKAWKYSFYAPNFHFDVQKNRRQSTFTDCYGKRYSIKQYVNVTMHGEVMSAK